MRTSEVQLPGGGRVNDPGVMDVDEFLAAANGDMQTGVQVQAGDEVKGSDHGDIGEVKEVVGAAGDHDAYMLVPRGLIFEKDTYIPLDAVVRRSGSTVFINVPKLVVGSMPWSETPKRQERRAKQGPTSGSVSKLYRSRVPTIQEQGEGAAS